MATTERYSMGSTEEAERFKLIEHHPNFAHDFTILNYFRLWFKIAADNYPIGFQPWPGKLLSPDKAAVNTPQRGPHEVKIDELKAPYKPGKRVLLSKHDL